jgi:uncharacterized integral membrane protein
MAADDELTPGGKPPPSAAGQGAAPSDSPWRLVKVTLTVILLGYLLLLVMLNRSPVDIDLGIRTVTIPLVVIMLAMLLLGALLALAVRAFAARRRARRAPRP